MTDERPPGMGPPFNSDAVRMLADALYPHLDDWYENGSEDYNRRHRDEIAAALDAARQLGWTPRA